MAPKNIKGFRYILQDSIKLDDREWRYRVPNLPHVSSANDGAMLKSVAVVSNNVKQNIVLRFERASINRAMASDPLDRFILISFADFRLRIPLSASGADGPVEKLCTPRESADYIVRLLKSGIELNGVHYNFYGHSNSQLKSRSCVLFAASKAEIALKVNALGDFSKMKTVAKKAKRIGLLFSTAQMATEVKPDRCEDIPDVLTKDYIFTDGCGLISKHLADLLVQKVRIDFRNLRYTPSVYQLRYRGYKGVVMLDPTMKGQICLKLRGSMKKFSGGDDFSFSVVDYSKPYCFGYLNDEIILLLHTLGIQETVLLRKQQEHFEYLEQATVDPRTGFRFLTWLNRPELAEKVLLEGLESVKPTVISLVNSEYDRTLNKREEQRCRVLIPKSRLLFGICDSWNTLKEGECAVRVTMDGDGRPHILKGMEVLVTRNPCLHPGDLQKFQTVERQELAHLVDCIVFPTRGRRPSADLMSGGDLDGDRFFVCWDPDLVPKILSEPAQYPGAREPVKFTEITDSDRLEYFARYTNASLGRVKNLYLDWARLKGPMSAECQELNRLFSTCVDGNRIKVPTVLEDCPQLPPDAPPFILDTLHNAAEMFIKNRWGGCQSCDGYTFDAMELLLCRDDVAMSEFELVKLTYRWCLKNKADLVDFLPLFDFNRLSVQEKAWMLSHLPPAAETPSLVMNALLQSNLIGPAELRSFKLDHQGLRWKRIFDSTRDRLGTFLDVVSRTLELFHRKLIVIHVNDRFTVAVYVPRKVEKRRECQVDNKLLLFAFPHSQGDETSQRRVVSTKMNYRLYCDADVFQLYETHRRNTWVYIGRGASDESSYQNIKNTGDRRRERQKTLDSGLNHDCKVSIALQKFSKPLQKHVGTVNKNGILAAEIYVISNRDDQAMQTLDLWLHHIDTEERMPLFEQTPREYGISRLVDVNWSSEPEHLVRIAKHRDFAAFKELRSEAQFASVFQWLLERDGSGLLHHVFSYLLKSVDDRFARTKPPVIILKMIDFLSSAPCLAINFARMGDWDAFPPDVRYVLRDSASKILRAIVLSANEMQEFVVRPFKEVLSRVQHMPMSSFFELVELISLTVRTPEIALDLLLDCLEPRTTSILTERPTVVRLAVRSAIGIALDHVDEASQSQYQRRDLLNLKFLDTDPSSSMLQCRLRIDAPSTGTLAQGDHVRLTTANSPANSVTEYAYSMDAQIVAYDPGSAKIRCLHPPPCFVEDCSWRLENCGSFVTSKAMLDAVHTFVTQLGQCCGVYEQILGLPDCHRDPTSPKYMPRDDLNASQNRAVHASLSNSLTCMWGPPGTGKTYTIVAILRELLASEPEQRIMVSAPTHNAVDNVMRKFLKEVEGTGARHTALRVSTDVRKVSDDLKRYTCDAMVGKEISTDMSVRKKAQKRISECRLIFTTCIGAALGLLREEKFGVVIIDEASQQTEPASLVPLVKGCQKAILVGDHVQLRATVQQHAVLQQYDISLFERLYTRQCQPPEPVTSFCKVMLDTQYRMHEDVCTFSSAEFYQGQLRTGVAPDTRPLPLSEFPWPTVRTSGIVGQARMVFVQCSAVEDFGQKSKSNKGQAEVCRVICKMLCTAPPVAPSTSPSPSTSLQQPSIAQQSIAVLTPYTRQADLLKGILSGFRGIEVSSIDGFQGRESDIIIFNTVRCNTHHEIGFLKDMRRLNVALTRARAAVIVVGDRDTLTKGTADLESTRVWKRLLGRLVGVELGIVDTVKDTR